MPASAYIIFSGEKRESIKKAHPDWSFGEIAKESGRLWKELSEPEKAKYQAKAAAQAESSGKGGKTDKSPKKSKK
jgi:hypothetical protein